jgi:hypothetical protein
VPARKIESAAKINSRIVKIIQKVKKYGGD